MPAPPTPATASYTIWRLQDGEKVKQVGWAESEPGGYTLASAWLLTAQQLYPTVGLGVGLYSDDTLLAYLGWDE